MSTGHISVMIREVLSGLNLRDGGTYIDGTFGRGGYTRAILDLPKTRVFGIDCDQTAINFGNKLTDSYDGRLTLLHGNFGNMVSIMAAKGISHVDGVMLDLGVSTPQIDDPNRGFSFRFDGPLDMRMDSQGLTAACLLYTSPSPRDRG